MERDELNSALSAQLDRLAAGDLTARDEIIALCTERLRTLAHRLLAGYPTVRRWDDTDDVFQNATMRLYRALAQVRVGSPRELMALAATQLHRELLDLARHHSGPMSYAANHGTNIAPRGGAPGQSVVHHVDRMPEADDHLDRWTAFHETIERLPAEQRELFHLVWHLGADQKTVAQLLDCSERTVKSRWREVREAVKSALDGQSPE
jgi:RNA polymerase sigma factor (sigma-70 family)